MNPLDTTSPNDEISLADLVAFFLDNGFLIASCVAIGTFLAGGMVFLLPQKFESSAAISGARVAGVEIEPPSMLLEKMKSPAFYGESTLMACGLAEQTDQFSALAKALKPSVAKQSQFVSVSYRSKSRADSARCLTAVLENVRERQAEKFDAALGSAKSKLEASKAALIRLEFLQSQEIDLNQKRLLAARSRLLSNDAFLKKFAVGQDNFKFTDSQFSANSLLLATVLSKQTESEQLQVQIRELEGFVAAKRTQFDLQVINTRAEIDELQVGINAPLTEQAQFSIGIFTPEKSVSPNLLLMVVAGALLGAFVGVLAPLVRRFVNDFRAMRAVGL